MIKISLNGKEYKIDKAKLVHILSALNQDIVEDKEITELIKRYDLLDEHFLKNINKL